MTEPWTRSPTFAVVVDGKLIGTVSFEVDATARTAMVGYAIARAWWGRGIAVEAARTAIAWAVEEFGLMRIWAATDTRNARSIRVLEKLGMVREAFRTAHIGRDGGPIHEVVYVLNLRTP
jgi:ribosomal-protein-alanine N-acetyltransferase